MKKALLFTLLVCGMSFAQNQTRPSDDPVAVQKELTDCTIEKRQLGDAFQDQTQRINALVKDLRELKNATAETDSVLKKYGIVRTKKEAKP